MLSILITLPALYAQNVLDVGEKENSFHKDQEDPSRMSDIYKKHHYSNRSYINLPSLREADVMWSRKIWREIDLRQKINHPLYYPQEALTETVDRDNLFTTLFKAATLQGEVSIRAYSNAALDDEFEQLMTPEELRKMIEGEVEIRYWLDTWNEDSLDANGNRVVMKKEDGGDFTTGGINRRDITKWRIKEQWFFDKQRSVMDVRIIGLCPVAEDRHPEGHPEEGELTGNSVPICWFYFPEARNVLRNAQAFNLAKNEAENKTFEDIFMKRMFSSIIVKEGNVFDREISQFMIGLDAILKSEEIKAELFNIEHDLWEY